jgi:hypothetical protein
MTVRVTPVFDCMAANIEHLPKGLAAGYTTGTDGTNGTLDIKWSQAEFNAHPGALRICQDAGATDHTADILDLERGAATLDDLGPWCRKAQTSFKAVERPGQREPSIYSSASNIPAVVTRLRADKVKGVFLVVANWNLDDEQATKDVEDASGEFPVVGVQWRSRDFYDVDAFSATYLENVSHVAPVVAGPYRHVTNGTESASMIADVRNETVLDLLSFSAKCYTASDVVALESTTLPSGIPYYTHRP